MPQIVRTVRTFLLLPLIVLKLSDKLILTPPYPGNQQGAAWTDAR